MGGGSLSFALPPPVTHIPFPSNTGTNAAQVRTLLVAAALLGHVIADLSFRQSEKVFFFRLVLIVSNHIKPKTLTVSVQPCCSGSSPRTSTLDTLSSS